MKRRGRNLRYNGWLLLAGLGVIHALLLCSAHTSWAADDVVISELMAGNTRTLADEDKAFEDWIELRNTGPADVNLDGWALTDDANKPRQWVFPATNLPAGGHLLVWASGKNRRIAGAPLHTNFRLSIT